MSKFQYNPNQFNSTRRISPGSYSTAAKNLTNAINNIYEINRKTAPDFSKLAKRQMFNNAQLAIEGIKAQTAITKSGLRTLGEFEKEKQILKGKEALANGRRAGRLMLYGGGAIMQGIKMAGRKPIEKPEPIYHVETPFKYPDSPYKDQLNNSQGSGLGPAPVMPDVSQFTGGNSQGSNIPFNADQPPEIPNFDQPAPQAPAVQPSGDQAKAFQKIYNFAKANGGAKHPGLVAGIAMHETGHLSAPDSVYMRTGGTNAFGQTGDRGWGTIPRKGHKDGWTIYPDLQTGVNDHIKLWHDTGNHSQNYNAFDTPQAGLNAVLGSYSPNSDPSNQALGYTENGYGSNVINIMRNNGVL